MIEVVLALGIFLIVIGIGAEVLVSYYVAIDMTRQRSSAVQDCIGVLNEMRDVRAGNPGGFPGPLVAKWPQGAVLEDAPFTPDEQRITSLPGESLTIAYLDENGNLIGGDPTAANNPLQVRVTCTWATTKTGRVGTASVSTMFTNE